MHTQTENTAIHCAPTANIVHSQTINESFPLRARFSVATFCAVFLLWAVAILSGCEGTSEAANKPAMQPSQSVNATKNTPPSNSNAEPNTTSGKQESGQPGVAFSYDDYSAILKANVDDRGMVDYRSLKQNREQLDAFADALDKLNREDYGRFTNEQKIAFWINAYNALTLKTIVDHYPIKASFFASFAYPKNSIRQISGVWDEITHPVLGERMTLDQIEHQVLRKKFNEPRIHMALVCAAMGCPPLRNEPYTGDKLDAQLADQTRTFLSNPAKFRIDRENGKVYLSSIFKWFGEDFIPDYAPEMGFSGHDDKERAVLNFIASNRPAQDSDFLRTGTYEIEYLDYDWSLNER